MITPKPTFVPNVRTLEIHITYKCNLHCNNCTNLISQAPAPQLDMTPDQMVRFLNESSDMHYHWEKLVLHGGEPTLHPYFRDFCVMLCAYQRQYNPSVKLVLATNGYGRAVKREIRFAEFWGIEIANSAKEQHPGPPLGSPKDHIRYNVSPVDEGADWSLGCFQTANCGIALNHLGFYECSPAAAMGRVFGYPPLATKLADVTPELMASAFEHHCRHCGLARIPEQRGPGEQVTSPTWEKALREYRGRKA